jgi:sentrin-specific protease 1
MIYIAKKRIKYYNSSGIGTGNFYLKNILQYLKDLDKEGKYIGADKWDLVTSTMNAPKQKNGYDCGVFTCMFRHYISNDLSLDFNETTIAPFQK